MLASHLPSWDQIEEKSPVQQDKYSLALPLLCCMGLAAKGLKRTECVQHALRSARRRLNMNDQIAFYFLN